MGAQTESYRRGMHIFPSSPLCLPSVALSACRKNDCVCRGCSLCLCWDTPTNDLCGPLGEIIAYSSIFQNPPPMSAGVFWHWGCPPCQMTEPVPKARVLSWRGRVSSWRWRWNQSYTKNKQHRLKASGSWLLYNPVEVYTGGTNLTCNENTESHFMSFFFCLYKSKITFSTSLFQSLLKKHNLCGSMCNVKHT